MDLVVKITIIIYSKIYIIFFWHYNVQLLFYPYRLQLQTYFRNYYFVFLLVWIHCGKKIMGTGNCGILWLLAGSLFTICCQLRRKSKTRLCWNCLWPQRIESIEGLTFFLPPKHWLRPIQLTHYSITFFCFSLQLFHIFPRVFLLSPFNYGSQIIFEFFHHTAEINVDCNFPPSTGSAPSLQPNCEQDGKGFEPFLVFSCVFFSFFCTFSPSFFFTSRFIYFAR